MDGELYNIFSSVLTIFLGGGWFLHWRASRRKANGEAVQVEADAFKTMQDAYQQTITDVTNTLNEVRAERDHYKDDRNVLRRENHEMRDKYIEIEDKMAQMEMDYKRDISRLSRRLDCLSPFLCSVVGCLNRRRVNVTDDEIIGNGEYKELDKENK